MKKTINTNAQAIVFAQDKDNKKAVVATRDGKEAYLAWALKQENEKIYGALGGKRREGAKYFCVDFPTVKNAKEFIAKGITHINAEEYAKARKPKTEEKTESKATAPATAKGKGKKAPKKSKGDVAPTTAPNAKKASVKTETKKAEPKKAKGNAELTDAQKKRLEICKMSILNRAASAYSIANGGEATTFKALGKNEADLKDYIPNAKAAMLKSNKWAKAVEMGITEDMLG